MISVEEISFQYPDAEPVLDRLSFNIAPGEKVVLLGVNGSGKTTLLRALDGLLFPQHGRYTFRGQAVDSASLRNREFNRAFRQAVVLLFQNPDAMIFNPTVYDEIAFGLRQTGADHLDERVRHWAAVFDITRHLEEMPFQLSGGEKQRVCLAALLALEPEVLLLDEPTANLDPMSTGWLVDFIQDLDMTAIMTIHSLGLAAELGERALVMSDKHQLIYDGDLAKFLVDQEKLLAAKLVHTHQHAHGEMVHRHYHTHDWD